MGLGGLRQLGNLVPRSGTYRIVLSRMYTSEIAEGLEGTYMRIELAPLELPYRCQCKKSYPGHSLDSCWLYLAVGDAMLHDLTTIDLLGRYIANPSPIDIDIRKDYQVPGYEGMVHCSSLSWSGPTNQSLDCGFVEPTCLVKESSNSCRTDNNSWPGIHLAVAFQALVCCTMLDWMLVKKKRYLDFEENFAHSSFRPENVERLVGHPSSSQQVRAPWIGYSSSRRESKLSQCTLYLVCISYRERSWTKREYGKPPGSWLQLSVSVCRRPGIYLP